MSLGSSDMAGSALGAAFLLLLFASIIQGSHAVDVYHQEKMVAEEGQNVTLPCFLENSSGLRLVHIEWRRNKNTKLVVYSSVHGVHNFWPNITIRIEKNTMGSYLQLPRVTKWDSDNYTCELSTFPMGSIRTVTELRITDDVKIKCDANQTVEVQAGENVTILCQDFPNTQYGWRKNEELVSVSASLALVWVTAADTGVYTLTVSRGNTTLHAQFIITVLAASTSMRTDLATVSPQSRDSIVSTDNSFTTTSTRRQTTDTNNVTITDGQHRTANTNDSDIDASPSPALQTDPYPFNNSINQETRPTQTLNTPVTSNLSSTSSYNDTTLRSTQETRNESMPHVVHPHLNSSTNLEESWTVVGNSDKAGATKSSGSTKASDGDVSDAARGHLLLVLIIIPVLVLTMVAVFLFRRQILKQRRDLPPPFKPPPPPVKYTARYHEIFTEPFPIARCNSTTEDTNQRFMST
ncbi:uncharacterized protein V6R79_020020 [Siganus canaliculatus]